MQLHEIRLAVRRLEEQGALYAEAFGLVARRDDGALVVEIGDARLVLAAGEPTPQHFAIRIPSASYADALGWLGERAELLTGEDGDPAFAFSDWNADSAYFADPDGNIVELIAHHDLPEPYTPPFGPSALLGICEAGMPVADVGAFLDELERRTGARRWSGDRETFTCEVIADLGWRSHMAMMQAIGAHRWVPRPICCAPWPRLRSGLHWLPALRKESGGPAHWRWRKAERLSRWPHAMKKSWSRWPRKSRPKEGRPLLSAWM